MSKYKLLTAAIANAKTAKNDSAKYLSAILHLAPANLAGIEGFNACPAASNGCKAACLNTAGRGGMFKKGENTNTIQQARIRRTKSFVNEHTVFMEQLTKDITKVVKLADKTNTKPVVRLNGTSDIDWENIPVIQTVNGVKVKYKNLFKLFPMVQFYDYSKRPDRAMKFINKELPSNYHLTFSCSESNEPLALKLLGLGINVAMVFKQRNVESYKGYKVIDGDNTDLRFNDSNGVIVGLTAKGRAKKDTTGFVK